MDKPSSFQASDSLGSILTREAQLSAGIGHGLSDAVAQTWSDLKDASHDPVKATETFLTHHWQDALVGAAITFMKPTGLGNAALLLYASRGLIGSVGSAMVCAARPDADMTAINANLEHSVARQGEQFVDSLPLAMAGGVAGKVGADTLFGQGNGALDLLPNPLKGFESKVSLADVKENFWNAHDQILQPKMKVLVTDIDGTLGPFSDYFAPGLRDNVSRLSKETGVPEPEIYQRLGTVMDANRSHDYPWSLEQSGLQERFNMTPQEFSDKVVKPFWESMDAHREQLLKPFDGVKETLTQLRGDGVRIIARSDAPYYIALARLKTMGLVPYVDELYAMDTPVPTASQFSHPDLLEHGKTRVETLSSDNSSFERTQALPRSAEKPAVGNLAERLDELGVRRSQVAVFGDSRVKDGGLAQNIGSKFYYAVFGAHPSQEYQDIFARLKRADDTSVSTSLPDTMAKPQKVYPPIAHEAAGYADILQLMSSRFDGGALVDQVKPSIFTRPSFKPAYAFSLTAPVVPESRSGRSENQ